MKVGSTEFASRSEKKKEDSGLGGLESKTAARFHSHQPAMDSQRKRQSQTDSPSLTNQG